jgi:PAS domain S-box-containing protein
MNMKARVRKLSRKGIAFYRGMLENQLDLIINISGDGTVLFVNQAFCDFYGRKAEEMEGRKITELNVLTIEEKQIAQLISIITPENPVKFYRNSFMKDGIESV